MINLDGYVIEHSPGDIVYSTFDDMVFKFKIAEVRIVFTKYGINLSFLPEGCIEDIPEDNVYFSAMHAFDALDAAK